MHRLASLPGTEDKFPTKAVEVKRKKSVLPQKRSLIAAAVLAVLTASTGASMNWSPTAGPRHLDSIRLHAMETCKGELEKREVTSVFGMTTAVPKEQGEVVVAGRTLIKTGEGQPKPYFFRCRYGLPSKAVIDMSVLPYANGREHH